jgi:hypothetical protein
VNRQTTGRELFANRRDQFVGDQRQRLFRHDLETVLLQLALDRVPFLAQVIAGLGEENRLPL